jgi:hypothetical protein
MIRLPVLLEGQVLKYCAAKGLDPTRFVERALRRMLYEQAELDRLRARGEREAERVAASVKAAAERVGRDA